VEYGSRLSGLLRCHPLLCGPWVPGNWACGHGAERFGYRWTNVPTLRQEESHFRAVGAAVFSSIFAQLAWWSWAFWVLVIACVVAAVASYLIISTDKLEHGGAVKFDVLGRVTGVTGLILFNFAWNQAAVVGRATVYIFVLLIVGILFLVAFIWVEIKMADQPLVPLKALSQESILALTVIAAGWGSFGVWV
jgi:hypothetical protein